MSDRVLEVFEVLLQTDTADIAAIIERGVYEEGGAFDALRAFAEEEAGE